MEMSADLICRDRREERLMRAILKRSQVKNRHTCLPYETAYRWIDKVCDRGASPGITTKERMAIYADHAGPLSVASATQALSVSQVDADEITHLVTVTCTGFEAPGVDIHLIESLGLPRNTQRIQVGYMGCHGAINAMRVADAIGRSDPSSKTLVCATELCSLHYRTQWDDERMLGNALFADGSAAFVSGQAKPEQLPVASIKSTASYLAPDSRELMSWTISNHGFEMTLSNLVPDAIQQTLRPWLNGWLDSQGLTLNGIGSWAVHPGGPRILRAVEESLQLQPDALDVSRGVLREYGNMSSPTVLFVLDRLTTQAAAKPCVALSFGPGLMIEAALLDG